MSRIYFHTEGEEAAEVRGSERAHMGVTCSDVAVAMFGVTFESDPIRRILPKEWVTTGDWVRMFKTNVAVHGNAQFETPERPSVFDVVLNTALAVGGDGLKIMARLHGQCEIHAYVEGVDRAWLADIVDAQRRLNILRADQGWEGLSIFLRQASDRPVVTSYSVTEQFPNPTIIGIEDEDASERWWEKSEAERWADGLAVLRANHPRLQPESWSDYRFTDGITAMDLRALVDARGSDGT